MPIPKWCDPKSIRTVKRGGASILVCCPKQKFRAGRCSVGTRHLDGFAVESGGRSKVRSASSATKQAAAVAYMRRLDPDLNRGQPDAFVLTHWRKWQRASGDRIVETLDGFTVSSSLTRGAAKEAREHPWASKSTARRIARDHLVENPRAYGALPRSWRGLKSPVSTPAGQNLHYVWALVSEHDGKWYVQATRPTHKAAVEAQRQNPRWTVIDTRKFPHRLY